jgi:hypothetical protein
MKVKAAVARAKSCPFGRMASAQVLSWPTPFCRKDTFSGQFIGCPILDGLRTDPDGEASPFLSEALYSLQLRMRYVCFFMAEKAYQVASSATLHSDSYNKTQKGVK